MVYTGDSEGERVGAALLTAGMQECRKEGRAKMGPCPATNEELCSEILLMGGYTHKYLCIYEAKKVWLSMLI
jgi:hypothetical protein